MKGDPGVPLARGPRSQAGMGHSCAPADESTHTLANAAKWFSPPRRSRTEPNGPAGRGRGRLVEGEGRRYALAGSHRTRLAPTSG